MCWFWQLDNLESSINKSVAAGINTINAIYNNHPELPRDKRVKLIHETKKSLMFAEEVIIFYYKNSAIQWIAKTELKPTVELFQISAHYR